MHRAPTFISRLADGTLDVPSTPVRLSWTCDDLPTADHHTLSVSLSFSIRALSTPTELKMLAETFLSQTSVATTDDVAAYFRPYFYSTAATLTPCKSASAWRCEASRSELLSALISSAHTIAFTCGLEI